MEKRSDYKTALLIDAVLHQHAGRVLAGAACELAAMGVPLEVAMRVLTRPEQRRYPTPPPEVKRTLD